MWVEITEQENASVEQRHPLREDVSWNNVYDDLKQKLMGHPLREDVSWNVGFTLLKVRFTVILFVRMWVEIMLYLTLFSAPVSHPLREDVSWNVPMVGFASMPTRHPLREDVSWNTASALFLLPPFVILFVRMWVEIFARNSGLYGQLSSSSWGCELK